MPKKKVSKRVLAFRKGLTEHFKGNPPDFDFNPLTSDLNKAPKLLVDIKKQKKMVEYKPTNNMKELAIIFTPVLFILLVVFGVSHRFWVALKCLVLGALGAWVVIKWMDYVVNLRIK